MFDSNNERILYGFLIFFIFVGVFFRFYQLDSGLVWRDESTHFIAALKLNHHNPNINSFDPRRWHIEYPPLGDFVMGLPTQFVQEDYRDIIVLNTELPFSYVPSNILKKTFILMRLMTAIIGTLVVILVFFITKALWGKKAALWSAALISLSVDFIGISRVAYLEIYMICFFLFSIFFYLKYLNEKNLVFKLLFVFLTIFSVILTIGSRTGPSLLIYPILVLPLLIISKERENIKSHLFFIFALILSWPIFYYFIMDPFITSSIFQRLSLAKEILFQNNILFVFGSLFFKNSYLFLFSFFLFILYFFTWFCGINLSNILKYPVNNFKNILNWKADYSGIRSYMFNPDIKIIIPIFFLISIIFFSTTLFGANVRYFTILFVPAMIFLGPILEELSEIRFIAVTLIVLAFLTIFSLINLFPYYTNYGNFGNKNYSILNYDNKYDLLPEQLEIFKFLEEKGDPKIFTNLPNLLLFYKGEANPMPPNDKKFKASKICERDFFNEVEDAYFVLLLTFNEQKVNWSFCQEFAKLNLHFLKEWGDIDENRTRFPFGTISIFNVE